MKLAFCLFKYFPFGGLQRDFIGIAKECLQRGHQVDVFTMQWEGDKEPGLSINILPVQGLQNHTRTKQFAAKVRQHTSHYDLVVGFNKMPGLDVYYAADTCYQAKAHLQRSAWYRLTPRYRQLIAAERAVFSAEHKTDILLLSKTQLEDFRHYYATQPERFHLIPPGITRDRIASDNAANIRQATRQALCIKENAFLLLLIGSGFKTKGLDRALLGFAALPAELRAKTHLFVVGKDNAKPFQQQARRLGMVEHIHFLGGRNDVPQLLLAGDILLHPAYNENTGTVLLEALVAGLPVLATDVCGYAHYIEEAKAGCVISSPFQQTRFNQILVNMLLSDKHSQWRENAIAFSKKADIYNMPIHAVNLLESFKEAKR